MSDRLALPKFGLGCATLGATRRGLTPETALAIVTRALERGVRFFDTAALYGGGVSECRLGRALAGFPRADVVISTKIGRYRAEGDLPPGEGGQGDHFDFSYDRTLRAVEESLKRLATDRLDIVHLHDCDAHIADAHAGAVPALSRLRDEGVVGAIGAGLTTVQPALELLRRVDLDALLIAGRYTLLDRSAEVELLPVCAAQRIAVIVGGVFNSGALVSQGLDRATFDYRPLQPAMRARILAVRASCAAAGVPLTAAALQFPLLHPAVASVLVGADSVEQLDANLDAFDFEVREDSWRVVEDGKPAA